MKTPNRRAERRTDIVNRVKRLQTRALKVNTATTEKELVVVDLTEEERREPSPRVLEGTGCLVLDNVHRVAYVSLSERADADLAATWGQRMGYKVVTFTVGPCTS